MERRRASALFLLIALSISLSGSVPAVVLAQNGLTPVGHPSPVATEGLHRAPAAPVTLGYALGTSPDPTAIRVRLSEIQLKGWMGINESNACSSACWPANPSLSSGNDYVLEASGSTYRIWTTGDTLVLNASLGSSKLFNTGADVLAAPEFYYDVSNLRWFASVEDVSKSQVYYAATATSDPTGSWYVQHFAPPPGGDVPTRPELSVSALNVVVTSDVFHGSTFEGSEIYVANETQLLANQGPATWTSTLSISNESVVPAQSLGAPSVTYLVTDREGGSDLNLSVLSGSPPGTPAISSPTVFASPTISPPAATQSGSAELVSTGTARVLDAVWEGGDLWATADVSCVPAGDSLPRACIHLWEIATGTDTMLQSFNWSSGAGSYDYDPAVSVDSDENVAVVFESSSATSEPSVEAVAQTPADGPGVLEPTLSLKTGTGPDNISGACTGGVCPFGNYSAATVDPLTNGEFWIAGEYTGADYLTDHWHTWVDEVSIVETYRANFSEENLPAGTVWSATINGVEESSSSPTIEFNLSGGPYTYSIVSPIEDGAGVQYAASPDAGSFTVSRAPTNLSVAFTEQFELSTSVSPSDAGTLTPSSGWFNASAAVDLSALPHAGFAFSNWSGTGPGSYSGVADPGMVVMNGPVSELASFSSAVTYVVTFEESGLPSGTTWTEVVNGISNTSTGPSITFSEPNGSYSYYSAGSMSGGAGIRYLASPSAGAFVLHGSGTSIDVAYTVQYALTTSVSPSDSGTVSPDGGWYNSSATVSLNALSASGQVFSYWTGSGPGAYSGSINPAPVTLVGPVSELAVFSAATTYAVAFDASGLTAGTPWSVALNGVSNSTTTESIVFNEPNGTYSYSANATIRGSPGSQFFDPAPSGSLGVGGAALSVTIAYQTQYYLSVSATPSTEGSVGPASGWYTAGTVLNLTAAGATGYQFSAWVGVGPGNYSGSLDPAELTVTDPMSESAHFVPATSSGSGTHGATSGTNVPAWELWAAIGALIAVFAVLAVLVLLARRRRAPPAAAVGTASSPSAETANEPWRE
jgi:hypothetical protein